jgi:hypothetical protein
VNAQSGDADPFAGSDVAAIAFYGVALSWDQACWIAL